LSLTTLDSARLRSQDVHQPYFDAAIYAIGWRSTMLQKPRPARLLRCGAGRGS